MPRYVAVVGGACLEIESVGIAAKIIEGGIPLQTPDHQRQGSNESEQTQGAETGESISVGRLMYAGESRRITLFAAYLPKCKKAVCGVSH